MAETAIPIFADLTNLRLLGSSKGDPISLPSFFHQDKLYLLLQPLSANPGGGNSTPFTTLQGTNYSVSMVLVTATGGTILSGPMTTWVTDGGTALLGSIDFNTAAMVTAFTSSSTTSVPALIQIQFNDGANGKWTIEKAVTIKRSYITAGSPTEYGLASYPTWAEALALFVRFSGNAPGSSITLPDSTGTHELIVQCNTDGSNASNAGS